MYKVEFYKAREMIEGIDKPQEHRKINVIQGDEVLWTQAVDSDADITWDLVRGILRINQR